MLHRHRFVLLLAFWISLGFVAESRAGSFYLPDMGARANGQGGAFAAQADDLMAVFYNPAGLAQSKGTQIYGHGYMANLYGLRYKRIDYNAAGEPTKHWDWISAKSKLLPSGSFAASTDFGLDRFTFGISFTPPYAAKLNYTMEDPTVYFLQYIEILFTQTYFTTAMKVTDNLFFGLGVGLATGKVELQTTVDALNLATGFPPSGNPAFRVPVKAKVDDMNVGGNVGFLWKVTPKFNIGATYYPPVPLDLEGKMEGHLGSISLSPDVTIAMTLPQNVTFGTLWRPLERLGVNFDVQWAEWSTFQAYRFMFKEPLSVPGLPLPAVDNYTIQKGFHPSWTFRLGSSYKLNDTWTVRGGYTFDMTPVPDGTLSIDLPDANKHRVSVGATWIASRWLTLDMAYFQYIYNERNIDNSKLVPPQNGIYQSSFNFISLGTTFKL